MTRDVGFVVTTDAFERTISLEDAGFRSERFEWSVNFKGQSRLSIQPGTEEFYRNFPSRARPADVHGILLRVASLEDTLQGKIRAWGDTSRRQSKRIKHLGNIARLIEAHPHPCDILIDELKQQIQKPHR